MKLTSSLLVLTTTLLSLDGIAAVTGGSLYAKLVRAAESSPEARKKIFTSNYRFNPKSVVSVSAEFEGISTRLLKVETRNGNIRFGLNDKNARLEFSDFESKNILSTHAYREVEVERWHEGRSWAPEFGAAVIPNAHSRSGWARAVYEPPRDGRPVWYKVVERETEEYTTSGFFHAKVHNGNHLRVSMAHKVEQEVVVPGSTTWIDGRMESLFRKEPVTRTLYGADIRVAKDHKIVYSEVQQTGPGMGYVLVVKDTGAPQLEGAAYSLSFDQYKLEVGDAPLRGSQVLIERAALGLDLPARAAGRSRATRLIEE